MPLTRTRSWDTQELDRHLREVRGAKFAWGQNDCCLFAANAVHAITGTDIAADFRGKYTDAASAYALIATVTGSKAPIETAVADAAAWCAAKHGMAEWLGADGRPLPWMARRGDLVVMRDAGRLIAGVVHLNGKHAVSIAESGPVRLSILDVVRAWRV